MSTAEMPKHLPWSPSNCSLVGCAAHGVVRGSGDRLQQLATAFRLIRPDLDPIRVLSRTRSRIATTAAFADGVAGIGTIAHEVDAATVFHCSTRSYFGFQPLEMPFDIKDEAMKS